MKKTPCKYCTIEDFCAANNWKLFDRENKHCPNHKEGIRQWKQFIKDEGYKK